MTHYSWNLISQGSSTPGIGDRDALVAAVVAFDPPGVEPPDWIVDILLADGFTDGQATYRHEGAGEWSLDVRDCSAS